MAANIYIGKRLSFDGQLCTVQFRGPVEGTKGEWLGVEWDDPTRGKHSGEHQGHRYFKCLSTHATAGSFIRPTRKPDAPRSFVEALKAKYADDDFEDPSVKVVFVMKEGDNARTRKEPTARPSQPIRFNGKVAEEVGFDKIKKQLAQLEELKFVILDGLRMWRPEVRQVLRNDGELEWPLGATDILSACPKTCELDLSRNLFEEWREVGSICEQLDQLRSLRVDGTRFRDTSLTAVELERCIRIFAKITTLKLEDDLLPWEDLASITHQFSALTTFSASSNFYSHLTPHVLNPTITNLILEENLLPSLSALEPLTRMPNLQRLVLKSNKISDVGTPTPIFPTTLKEVDLSFNDITTWSFIEHLEHIFPGLTSLRVSHNPLFEALQAPDGRALTADDGYMLTLARLGKLTILNHSPISDKERLNAESYYLSLIVKEVQYAPENRRDLILDSHPRYKWLCEEYGEPDIKRNENAVNPNSLAARLMKIRLYLADDKTKAHEVEIPMSCTAYTVLGVVGRRFGLMPIQCRLIWETGDWMPAKRTMADVEDEDWDSEYSEDETATGKVMREVEITPGTRSIGTWIDGMEATVRVELKGQGATPS
ncbi:tubulin-specific chaperone-like protein E [Boeremia exigua]|uniref:tubulin-specific chaperone-like protein E n=1 Tax=Boeremia exigua TaxID=749465 RepID=UPI001E8DF164|nr:tubulin-specific chaperone-like protein E [Boeremia exigua]KAH6615037.1 tubulin-specific chaperone-like protein E [Boeremia exigua]